jgi:hypothetical protein
MKMGEFKEIKEGDVVLARLIPLEAGWKEGLAFFSQDDEFIQVGQWGYESGKILKAHAHNVVPRTVPLTQEVLFIMSGRLRADVYNSKAEKVAELEGRAGDVMIMLNGGHGYEILEDGTRVLEVKNGPYVGAEEDRRRL